MRLGSARWTILALVSTAMLAGGVFAAHSGVLDVVRGPHVQHVVAATEVVVQSERIAAAWAREVAANRGLLLTGRPEFREEAEEARLDLSEALAQLERGGASLGTDARRLQRELRTYRDAAAGASLPAPDATGAQEPMRDTLAPHRAVSGLVDAVRQAARRELARAHMELDDATVQARGLSLGLLLVSFALLVALAALLVRMARREDRRLAEWEDFLATASHDLKTPLSTLRLEVQRLRRRPGAAELDEPLARMHRQVDRMVELVGYVLDVTRLGAGHGASSHAEEGDLAAIVRSATEPFAERIPEAGGSFSIQAEPVAGTWEAARVEQVVSNLLSNALKYAGSTEVRVEVRAKGDRAVISVSDAGPGIAPEDQALVFDRFKRAATRGRPGHGLGLWITKRLVESSGGRIELRSTLGAGATFTVDLPRWPRGRRVGSSPAGPVP